MTRKKQNPNKKMDSLKQNRKLFFIVIAAIVLPAVAASLFSVQIVMGANAKVVTMQQDQPSLPTEFYSQYGLGLLSAAIAVGGSCLGAGIAIYGAASAGAAAIAERPETSIWVLILAGLGEGVAIYGLLIAIIILSKLPAVPVT